MCCLTIEANSESVIPDVVGENPVLFVFITVVLLFICISSLYVAQLVDIFNSLLYVLQPIYFYFSPWDLSVITVQHSFVAVPCIGLM